MAATVYGTAIDTNPADIQPPGPVAGAGATGKAADAGHVHPVTGLWPGTALGDVAYGGAAGIQTRLAGNASVTRKFFRQVGTGSASAAPAWDTIQVGDLPAGYSTGWINPMSAPYNAVPGSGADTAPAINAAAASAAAFGASVYLTAALGPWTTRSPVQIPPCVSIITDGAQENTTYLDSSLGTILQPAASWSQGSCPANAVVAVLGQTDATPNYAVTANEAKITGLYVDCHLLPATLGSTDGIQLYGGVGRCHLERVLIGHAPNVGFNTVADGGGSRPGSYRLDRVNVRYAGQATSPAQGYGFWINRTSDVSIDDCLAENCAGDGWYIVNLSNGIGSRNRSEHNGGNGVTYECSNSSTGSGTGLLNSFTTDRNEHYGIEIFSGNGSGVPVQLGICRFRRDGRNGGSGGGGYAAIYIHGFPGTVQITGTSTWPGVNDGFPTPSETNSPQIGLKVASNTGGNVVVSGSYLQGATTAISDDLSGTVLYDLATLAAIGTTGSPTLFGPRTGASTLSGGTKTIACTAVRTQTSVFVTMTSSGAHSGFISVSKNPGTGFTVNSSDPADNNSFNWWVNTP